MSEVGTEVDRDSAKTLCKGDFSLREGFRSPVSESTPVRNTGAKRATSSSTSSSTSEGDDWSLPDIKLGPASLSLNRNPTMPAALIDPPLIARVRLAGLQLTTSSPSAVGVGVSRARGDELADGLGETGPDGRIRAIRRW